MKLQQLLLGTGLVLVLAGSAYLAKEGEPSGARMAGAADNLIKSFTDTQKSKALLDFDNKKERENWNFVPMQDKDRKPTRKGLPMEEMTAEQKDLARALLKACTSLEGYGKATTIMSLEAILRDLEKGGAMVRNPGWYFFSFFGAPSKTGKWGFRIEGHHLSLNFTLDRGQVIGFTPCFFGANPAEIKEGSRKGEQVLPEAEDIPWKILATLTAEQRKVVLQDKQFAEIEQHQSKPNVGKPVGLAASEMTAPQKALLLSLLKGYLGRVPPEIAAVELAEVEKAGLDKVHFAFAGEPDKKNKPHSYRIQGPTFVIEFLNVQADSAGNAANHIHSAWRKLQGDFGLAAAK